MNEERIKNSGMTLPELILAVLMLVSFTGITVMVTQFTARFFQNMNDKTVYLIHVGQKSSLALWQ